jgi:hypothetical protein
VLDYRVFSDEGSGTDDFIIVDSSSQDEHYTVQALTPGVVYTFKVSARNQYGYGPESEKVSILAA